MFRVGLIINKAEQKQQKQQQNDEENLSCYFYQW